MVDQMSGVNMTHVTTVRFSFLSSVSSIKKTRINTFLAPLCMYVSIYSNLNK